MGNNNAAHDFIMMIYLKYGNFDSVIFSLPVVLLTMLIYIFVRLILQKRKFADNFKEVRKTVWLNELIRVLTVCWLTELFCLTLTPSEFWKDLWLYIIGGENPLAILFPQLVGLPRRGFGSINLMPNILHYALRGNLGWFFTSSSGLRTITQMLLNIALFVPFGLAAPFIYKKISFRKIAITGLLFSFFIEFVQFFIGRECEIDDLICNTLGAIIGYLMYLLIRKFFPKFIEKGKKTANEICLKLIEANKQVPKTTD